MDPSDTPLGMYSFSSWVSLVLLPVIECSVDLTYDKSVKNSIVGSQIYIQTNIFLVIQVSLFAVFLLSFSWIYHKLSGKLDRVTKDLEKVKKFLKDCIHLAEVRDDMQV